jgi:hypothetical protein
VGMAVPRSIFATLEHQRILRMYQGTLDFSWLGCPKSV